MSFVHSRVVAIHQPNFFPWLGYFNKLVRADIFIVLDNVQFPKTGRGTWMNRVRLSVGRNPDWVSMPVERAYNGLRLIREMKIKNEIPWRKKVLRSIEHSYRRAPYFHVIFPLLTELMENPTDHLVEFNMNAVRALAGAAGLLKADMVFGSTLDVHGQATELLIAMVKAVGGTTYLCGGGAQGYQEDEEFAKSGIKLAYQNFRHPEYRQAEGSEFYPGLSIIDAMMYCGIDGARQLIVSQPANGIDSAGVRFV